MEKEELKISGRSALLYHDTQATRLLIQPVDGHDLEVLNQEVDAIRRLTTTPFSLVALLIEDWNQELTPWEAPAVFGKIPFGKGAGDTLCFVTDRLLPRLETNSYYDTEKMKPLLGGYSLAGLFALWTGYQTDLFEGIAAASPSVWFPRWIDYATGNKPLARSIYLSLGDKEEKARNPVMAQVGNAIRRQKAILTKQEVNAVLDWNPGNHFVDSDKRMAKGFAWLLNARK